jgi:uncharacterized protein YodC (DUF2158 family)
MKLHNAAFGARELIVVKHGSGPRDLRIGDRVRLNSGGPVMTVVDLGENVVAAWRDGQAVTEASFAPACLSYAFAQCA